MYPKRIEIHDMDKSCALQHRYSNTLCWIGYTCTSHDFDLQLQLYVSFSLLEWHCVSKEVNDAHRTNLSFCRFAREMTC